MLPEFRVVQHERDEALLHRLKSFFGFGRVRRNHGTRKEFRVRGVEDLAKVVRFFVEHPLQTRKRQDFRKFARVIDIIREGKHRTPDGLYQIAAIAISMNRQKNRGASRILRGHTPNTDR